MDGLAQRSCTTCNIVKPILEFDKDRPRCKTCRRIAAAIWRKKNPDKVKAQRKRNYDRHAEQYKSAAAEWRRLNPDRVKDNNRRRYERQDVPKERERLRIWKRLNRERVAASDRAYRQANKEKIREITRRMQAMRARAAVAWANKEAMQAIYAEAIRLTKETGVPHEVDHIVPISSPIVCGLHCESNLQVLPRFYNRTKHNRIWPDMP